MKPNELTGWKMDPKIGYKGVNFGKGPSSWQGRVLLPPKTNMTGWKIPKMNESMYGSY